MIQKPSQEMPIAKAVISRRVFAVKKKLGVPEFKGSFRWSEKTVHQSGQPCFKEPA